MSVNRDADGRRWVAAEVEVPGTPEEVWQAIATGQGVTSWFVPTEKRDDGTIVSHFGPGMDAVARETAYDPPHRFVGEAEMTPGGTVMATEWIVEARAGGKCLVRVVHSLFTDRDDWDDQLEAIEGGWPDYFRILQLYLTHHAGQYGATIQLVTVTAEPVADAWEKLTSSLGLQDARPGERRATQRMAGIVDGTRGKGHPRQFLLRLDEPTTGLAHLFASEMGGAVVVVLRLYLYGDRAVETAARDEPQWQSWLQQLFPMAGSIGEPC